MHSISPHDRIVAFDLETTGLSPHWDRIVEFAAVCWQDGQEIGHFQTLVDPECPIPARVTLIHGITDDMVQGQPTVSEVLQAFLAFCEGDVLLAHNARFDIGFIRAACLREQLPMTLRPVTDTCILARKHLPSMSSYGLESLKGALGLSNGRSHRALQDARDCLALYLHCLHTGAPYIIIPPVHPAELPESLSLIAEALDRGQSVMIEYRDGNGRSTRREIRPFALDDIAIAAFCMLRNDMRSFLIDRIRCVWRPGEYPPRTTLPREPSRR